MIRSTRPDHDVDANTNAMLKPFYYFFVRLTTFLLFTGIFSIGLFILGFDLHLLLMKLESLLLGKGLSFLLQRVGWCTGGLIIIYLFDPEPVGNMMEASGSAGGSNSVGGASTGGGSSRGSGWTSFDLDILDENEEGEEVAQPHPQNDPAAPVDPDIYEPLLSN